MSTTKLKNMQYQQHNINKIIAFTITAAVHQPVDEKKNMMYSWFEVTNRTLMEVFL